MISGLRIEPGWISPIEESALLDGLGDGGPRGRAAFGRHRIERYGAGVAASGYLFGHVVDAEIPAMLEPIRRRLLGEMDANAITVAWYAPGDGVKSHVDRKECGEVIAIVSLGSDATMRMSPWSLDEHLSVSFPVHRRSLLTMRGEARHAWLHEILPVTAPRIAIVLRQAGL